MAYDAGPALRPRQPVSLLTGERVLKNPLSAEGDGKREEDNRAVGRYGRRLETSQVCASRVVNPQYFRRW